MVLSGLYHLKHFLVDGLLPEDNGILLREKFTIAFIKNSLEQGISNDGDLTMGVG